MKQKLYRVWHTIETATDIDMADASARIREHRDRQARLEEAEAAARATLSERKVAQNDVETIAACAREMSRFLKESEMTERKAFVETLINEIVVRPATPFCATPSQCHTIAA